MKIRAHQFNQLGWCAFCGCPTWARVTAWHEARGKMNTLPATDERRCIERDSRDIRPEPKRREYAVEDADVIAASILMIRALAQERCPTNSGLTLFDCLRSATRCGQMCKHVNDWIGPQR